MDKVLTSLMEFYVDDMVVKSTILSDNPSHL